MSSTYQTERLLVRPWTHDGADLARLYDIYSRWEVARWLGATPKALESPEGAAGIVDRWRARSGGDGPCGVWAVQVRRIGVIAGTVLLVPLPPGGNGAGGSGAGGSGATGNGQGGADEIEVGWHLHPDSWGHGYATEAARGAMQRGFQAGLAEIYAVVRPENAPSLAVCRRLGMRALGRTNRWYDTELEAFALTAGEELVKTRPRPQAGRAAGSADRGE